MSTFDHLKQVVESNNLQVRTQTFDDGRVGLTITFTDDRSAVVGWRAPCCLRMT